MTFDEARKLVAANVNIQIYWSESGDLRLLLSRTGENGKPLDTITSCKLSHAREYLEPVMRGLEIGAMIAGK